MIDSRQREQFLRYEAEAIVHPFAYTCFSREEVRANLERELDEDLRKGTSDEFAAKFRDRCLVSGATAADYKIRLLEIESGFNILAGIRFRGLDLNRPFVAILHRNQSLESDARLTEVIERLVEEFAVFAPKAILFYQSSQQQFQPPPEFMDKRILLGSLETLASIEPLVEVALVKATTLDFYDRYRDEYALVSEASPDFLRTETAESEEDLKECVEKELTYKVYIRGEFAGVFVVSKLSSLGLNGYWVIENLLFKEFRGRGFASSVQKVVADELRNLGGKVLFGSIYPTNFPSYRAALRSKRIDIGGNYMVPVVHSGRRPDQLSLV